MISCIHKKVPLVTSDKFHHTDFRNHQFLGNYEFVQWGISGKKRDLNNWLITFGAHALLKVLNRLIKWVWSGVWRHMQMLYMGPIVHTSAWVCMFSVSKALQVMSGRQILSCLWKLFCMLVSVVMICFCHCPFGVHVIPLLDIHFVFIYFYMYLFNSSFSQLFIICPKDGYFLLLDKY